MPSATTVLTATISSGQTNSDEQDIVDAKYVGLIMPATWTEADITFQVTNVSGGTWRDLLTDEGIPIRLKVRAAQAYAIDRYAYGLAPWRFLRIVSSVAQGAQRLILIVIKA